MNYFNHPLMSSFCIRFEKLLDERQEQERILLEEEERQQREHEEQMRLQEQLLRAATTSSKRDEAHSSMSDEGILTPDDLEEFDMERKRTRTMESEE